MDQTEQIQSISNFVDKTVQRPGFVVFAKSTCPYCARTEKIMIDLNQPCVWIDMDKLSRNTLLHNILKQKYNQHTVPYIFMDGRLIGGLDQFMTMRMDGTINF